jgi:hypothetical protein
MTPTWRLIIPALALALVLGACGRANASDYGSELATIELQLAPNPTTARPAALDLRLTPPTGAPIGGASLEVEGTMTHAGMTPVFATPTDQGAGNYRVDQFRFTMAGDWLIIVRATLPDGGKIQRTFPANGVREGAAPRMPNALWRI